jgi:nucleoid-associated protein YgaU
MALADVQAFLVNTRTGTLDLDSVYAMPAPPDPGNPQMMQLGSNSPSGGRPPGKGTDNDVPRRAPDAANPDLDRAALIGDPRNDENTIIAQMQVAFLKAHNALVGQGLTFEQARTVLRQHYQHIVIHDFLKRVCDPAIVDDILINGPKAYDPAPEHFFMPLEFTVAAYRFGHSMIRSAYRFNVNFQPATLKQLFTFTALSGQSFGFPTLPENWIIEWENFLPAGQPFANTRRIDTLLVEPLAELQDTQENPLPGTLAKLAVRNLLRGYLLRMPTGQAVAGALGIAALTQAEIEAVAAAAGPQQLAAVQAGGFATRTPLWYYVLAEAAHFGGNKMGPVGSTIVADVLIGLIKRSEDSIFGVPGWAPSLPSVTPGTFTLADLLALAGVLPIATQPQPGNGGGGGGGGGTPPPGGSTYVVQPGDTLSGIAQSQLGDASRWPEIFALNQDQISNPDLIFPGQVLVLPPGTPPPAPPTYVVQPGDTLSGIAQSQLGNAARWPEIFALNSNQIQNPNIIFPGQVLVLPV